jgi:molybdopterin molybdotransferase
MLGIATQPQLDFRRAPLASPLGANGPRESYLRAVLGREGLVAFTDQDSSLLSVFSKANALVQRATNAPAAEAGEMANYILLS